MDIESNFQEVAKRVSEFTGTSKAFLLGVGLILGWLGAGFFYQWSNGHSLFINTLTTIITFLMVFIIQNTQNNNDKALHLKLDELIRAIESANNELIGVEKKKK